MLTVEKLREWGADTDEALRRCLNNETFYLTLVGKAAGDPTFDRLREAIGAKDLDRAFDLAHALKGVMANLALTPLTVPVSEITEILRSRADTDYAPYLDRIDEKQAELKALFG